MAHTHVHEEQVVLDLGKVKDKIDEAVKTAKTLLDEAAQATLDSAGANSVRRGILIQPVFTSLILAYSVSFYADMPKVIETVLVGRDELERARVREFLKQLNNLAKLATVINNEL